MVARETYFSHIEEVLPSRSSRFPSYICEEYATLEANDKVAVNQMVIFLGCKGIAPLSDPTVKVSEKDRLSMIRLMLLTLSISSGEPRWSSFVCDRLWTATLSINGGKISDLHKSLFLIFKEFDIRLSQTVANFIQDITYRGRMEVFKAYRELYLNEDFSWMIDWSTNEIRDSQAYLLIYAAPRALTSSKICSLVHPMLENTPYRGELESLCEEDSI